jgi:hypothetical protein
VRSPRQRVIASAIAGAFRAGGASIALMLPGP